VVTPGGTLPSTDRRRDRSAGADLFRTKHLVRCVNRWLTPEATRVSSYAGVDVGATSVRAIVGDETGRERGRARRPTPTGPDGETVAAGIVETLRAACDAAAVTPEALQAVGVGSMGPLDLAAGAIDGPVNLAPSVRRVPLRRPLREATGTDRVYLHNDTDAGAIGERFYGAGAPENLVYLTVSSGIGAGVILGGDLLVGANGNAGEVGHVTVDADGSMTCRCGTPGHWEAYCSGHNIPRFARTLHEAADGPETALPVRAEGFDAAAVYDAAGTDRFADRVLERVDRYNAVGVADVVHSFAPDVIAVGGAVAVNNPDRLLAPIRERLPELVYVDVPEVRLTALGDGVVLRGALASALTGGGANGGGGDWNGGPDGGGAADPDPDPDPDAV
jgi:glucokinase